MPVINVDGTRMAVKDLTEANGKHSVKIQDRTVEVELLRENSEERLFLVKADGKVNTVRVGESLDSAWFPVQLNGRTFKARIEGAEATYHRGGLGTEGGPVVISSPMSGKIVALKTSIGARVAEGQALVILEAMKMENEIGAPKTGIVKELLVQQGALVKPGDKLAVVE